MKLSDVKTMKDGDVFKALVAINGIIIGDNWTTLIIQDLSASLSLKFEKVLNIDIKPDTVVDILGVLNRFDSNKNTAVLNDTVTIRNRSDWDVSAFKYTPLNMLNKMKQNSSIRTKALIADKKTLYTKANVPYLMLKLQDSEYSMDNPIWDNYDYWNEQLNIGDVVEIYGQINYYQEVPQIKNLEIKIFKNEDAKNYIPHYDVGDELIIYFIDTVEGIKEPYKSIAIAAAGMIRRPNGDIAIGDTDRWHAFITAPAATTHHHNKIAGLFLHTIGLLKYIDFVEENYLANPFFCNANNVINIDRLRLKAILHDLGKVEEYEFGTVIRRKNLKRDHRTIGATYVELLNKELDYPLSDEEVDDIAYSILCHHGDYGENGKFEIKSLEDILLHLADMTDAKIVTFSQSEDKKQTMG